MEKFRFFDHTADVKFQAYGATLEEAFSNAVFAMYSVIMEPEIQQKLGETEQKYIEVEGKDLQALLYNFLEEFIILLDAEFFLLKKISNIKIQKKDNKFILYSTVIGDTNDNYETEKHIKAVTYNEMLIKKIGDKYCVQVILDI
ncbi:MAG: archease [Candidatus Woesearchaeota archaeon]